jgi:carboxylate-amine ligase
LRESVAGLIEELAPTASRLGCLDELELNLGTLDNGPSYERQRRVLDAGGSLVDVVDALVEEFEKDRPRPEGDRRGSRVNQS